jgi:hypothetical protein
VGKIRKAKTAYLVPFLLSLWKAMKAEGRGLCFLPSWWNNVVVVVAFSVLSPVVIVGSLPHHCRVRLSEPSCYGGGGVIDVSVEGMERGVG